MNTLALFRSKLVWGAIIGAAGWVLQQPHVDLQIVIQAIGAVIAAAGTRDAIKKSAPTNSIDGKKAVAKGEM